MGKRGLTRLALAVVMALACAAMMAAASASAATEVAYNNLNTVPTTVNGKADEDTYSQDYEAFMGGGMFGGQIETVQTNSRVLKGLTTQVDVFACETGEYQLETCRTRHESRKFAQEWTANVYEVGAGNEPGALVATSKVVAKLRYRPSTNSSCPATVEGKGFGSNCDVGGLLQTIKFKKFTQARPLPIRAIVLLTNSCEACGGKIVNVGLQTAYKEFAGGEFVAQAPADGGIPAVGADPLPEGVYDNSRLEASGWKELQPVFQVEVR